MRPSLQSASALLILLASPISADHMLTFPMVEMGTASAKIDEWKDFKAQVMTVNNDITTYSVGCATDPCAGWGNLPDFTYTIAIGPSTFDMKYSDEPILSTSTACTFSGSPATWASCSMSNAGTIRTSTMGYTYTFTAPSWTGSGNWDLYNIQTASIKVVDGTAAASGSKASETGAASGSGSSSGSMITPAPSASGSGNAKASGTASSAFAAKTGVPVALGVGMGVVGAVLGL